MLPDPESEPSDDDAAAPPDEATATLYDVLHCAPDATHDELRVAYKQQALHWHPDKNSEPEAEERFKRINTAWSTLSDENSRAAYDNSLRGGPDQGIAGHHNVDVAACRAAWQAFLRAEELARQAERRRERGLVVFVCSLALWVVGLLASLSWLAGESVLLFPPPLELPGHILARYPLGVDYADFLGRLVRHPASICEHASKCRLSRQPAQARDALSPSHAALRPQDKRHGERTPPPRSMGGSLLRSRLGGTLLRTHTPYLRIDLNSTSEVRRAPAVGRPKGRGWLLVSSNSGEDIYGRQLDLVSHTFLFMPGESPRPWPSTTVCARLLRSGSVKSKEWWPDMSRALGGRLRPFALAVVNPSECEPEYGVVLLGGVTAGALMLAVVTAKLLT